MRKSEELLKKAIEIVEKAEEKGVYVRLLGGLAFDYLARNAKSKELRREHDDIDLAALRSQAGKLKEVLLELGLEPNNVFNALHGYERLQFFYGTAKVDVFLDYFRMCHFIDLRSRILSSRIALPPSDLLLTKLQIHEINKKDMKDIILLLTELKFGNADSASSIDAGYIASLLARDWGFYKTATDNIEKTRRYLTSISINKATKDRVASELAYLSNAIDQKPKTASWKLRAKIGERVRWYLLPEEVEAEPMQQLGQQQASYELMTFSEIDELARRIAKTISGRYGKPTGIIYIERGGMVFGNLLAKYMKVRKLAGVQAVEYKGIGERGQVRLMPSYINIENKGYVLLADDITDTGETMKKVVDLLSDKYSSIVKATLAYKPRSKIVPDVYGRKLDNDTWLIFDYEENEAKRSLSKSGSGKAIALTSEMERKDEAYEKVKKACRNAAARILHKGKPQSIIYLADSTATEARLLSDYLNVNRVIGVELSKEFESVLGKLLGNRRKQFALIVAPSRKSANEIEKMAKANAPEIETSKAIVAKKDSTKNVCVEL